MKTPLDMCLLSASPFALSVLCFVCRYLSFLCANSLTCRSASSPHSVLNPEENVKVFCVLRCVLLFGSNGGSTQLRAIDAHFLVFLVPTFSHLGSSPRSFLRPNLWQFFCRGSEVLSSSSFTGCKVTALAICSRYQWTAPVPCASFVATTVAKHVIQSHLRAYHLRRSLVLFFLLFFLLPIFTCFFSLRSSRADRILLPPSSCSTLFSVLFFLLPLPYSLPSHIVPLAYEGFWSLMVLLFLFVVSAWTWIYFSLFLSNSRSPS